MNGAITDRIRTVVDRARVVDSDKAVATLFLLVAVYVFLEARSYPRTARMFPSAIAVVTGVGSLAILLQELLPGPIEAFVAGGDDLFDSDEMPSDSGEPDSESVTAYDPVDSAVTAVAIAGYTILSLVAGFLIATPIFVAAYGIWKELSWLTTGGLVFGTTAFVYVMGEMLNIAMNQPLLTVVTIPL